MSIDSKGRRTDCHFLYSAVCGTLVDFYNAEDCSNLCEGCPFFKTDEQFYKGFGCVPYVPSDIVIGKNDLKRMYDIYCGRSIPENCELYKLSHAVGKWISSIRDDSIRAALYERYINCRSWEDIAYLFCLGSVDSIKKRCTRYIDMNLND